MYRKHLKSVPGMVILVSILVWEVIKPFMTFLWIFDFFHVSDGHGDGHGFCRVLSVVLVLVTPGSPAATFRISNSSYSGVMSTML